MTTKKRLTERRERNRQLAEMDAKHRCGTCKRELPRTGVHLRWHDPHMYCSSECLADADALASTKGMR